MNHHAPEHGRDPWLGPQAPKVAAQRLQAHPALDRVVRAVSLFTGADTIASDIGLLPEGLDAYMSYVDNFGGFAELEARFGHTNAVLISITIFGNPAVCGDFEPGAMHASDFPHWYDNHASHRLGLPWGYTSASNMQALIDAAAGRPFVRWSAHYGFGPHICGPATCGFPQAHWTQWDDHGAQGQNLDRSLGHVLPGLHPKPPTPEEIMAITAAQLQGVPHVFVEDKNGNVWYTIQKQGEHGWSGGQAGKQIAGLTPFAPAPK